MSKLANMEVSQALRHIQRHTHCPALALCTVWAFMQARQVRSCDVSLGLACQSPQLQLVMQLLHEILLPQLGLCTQPDAVQGRTWGPR